MNINQFNDVVELAELAGINEVRLLKFVPQGRGRENKEVLQLSNEELLMFIKDCQSIKTKKKHFVFRREKSITFDEKLGALPTLRDSDTRLEDGCLTTKLLQVKLS